MSTPYEQDIILDADGQPVFASLARIKRELAGFQAQVDAIGLAANKGAAQYAGAIRQQTMEMAQGMKQIRTLAQATNTPGFNIQNNLANQQLGKQTVQATAYARGLTAATTAAEALRGKEFELTRQIAERGKANKGELITQTRQRKMYADNLNYLQRLDRQLDVLDRKAKRTKLNGADMAGNDQARERLMNARARVERVALDPGRRNIGRELGMFETELMQYDKYLGERRTRHAQLLTDERRNARQMKTLRAAAALDDGKANAVTRAKEIQDIGRLNAARTQSVAKLQQLRTARAAANNPADLKALNQKIILEKAYIVALEKEINAQNRLAAAESRRVAGNGAGGRPQNSPTRQILTPGYAGAALARTGVYGAAAGAAYGGFSALRGASQYIVEFEDSLAKLAAIANATDSQMSKLKGSILEVAGNSRFSTVELSNISQQLAQAGVTAGQMKSVLESVTELANASGSTPAESVNLVTAALGAFQLQATEAERVADLMTTALNRTRLTVGQAGAAIQYVGATAYEQNITIEELLATSAAMSQAGIKSGSTIGTGLRQFLVRLASPAKKLQSEFDKLNLTTAELDVTTRGLPAVLQTLSDAGFGAAQAYAGLETRAAAAYLVLKNNTGLIDELRLQMTTTGASAEANAKAMDSMSAQWQRFKNLFNDKFEKGNEGIFLLMKEAVTALGDSMEETGEKALTMGERISQGYQGYLDRAGGDEFKANLSYIDDNTIPDTIKMFLPQDGDAWFDKYVLGVPEVISLEEQWATQLSESTERVETQQSKVAELEKEYQRLLVQKESLQDNDVRSQAEMIGLTTRFEELGLYLDQTKTQYDSLTGAVWQYINASKAALASEFQVQATQFEFERKRKYGEANNAYQELKSDPITLQERLTSREMKLFQSLTTVGVANKNYDSITRALSAAASRNVDNETGKLLKQLTDAMLAQSAAFRSRNYARTNRDAADAGGTDWGVFSRSAVETASAMITEARSLRGATQKAKIDEANKILDAAVARLQATDPTKSQEAFYKNQLAELKAVRQGGKALLVPAERSTREVKRREREQIRDAQRPLVTREAVISTAKEMFGDRVRVGSGFRSRAHQTSLHRRGKTGATADTSMHSNGGIGQDFPTGNVSVQEGRRMAASLKARLDSMGVKANVIFETGIGNNQGTGKHIHVGIAKGTRFSKGSVGANGQTTDVLEQQRAARRLARAQEQLDRSEMDRALDDAAEASTSEIFNTSLAAARAAKDKVEENIKAQGLAELATQGYGPLDTEYQAKLAQMDQQIQRLNVEFQADLIDSIIDRARKAFEQAERATAEAMRGSDLQVKLAEGRVRGFGYASNDGKIPDYVKQLADRRAAQAQEQADRVRLSTMPQEIGSKQIALSEAERRLSTLDMDSAAYGRQAEEIARLREEIRGLQEDQIILNDALTAGDAVPRTIQEGLQQAIEAYQEYNNLNRTFEEEVIFNLGGALTKAHESINTFFEDIFTGSKSVLDAFGDMALGMLRYLQQMAAQFVANQIFGALLNLAGAALGGGGGFGGGLSGAGSNLGGFGASLGFGNAYRGGKAVGGVHNPIRRMAGGKVLNGLSSRDSVHALLAKDEWVINGAASAQLGDQFMSDLNSRGAAALTDVGMNGSIIQKPEQHMNVWLLAPDQKPSLSENDVVIKMQDELMNGESRKLVKSISQE